ncbi:MAG: type II CRISPR RNA-guided endonuclease Cas9 [Clostridia bacterium]|nr:type II CRISPR RNA-guided endonuclease Cas9 [Clostridia bacterium]
MKKYYIGIDVGTDSVGIACTDEEYNLMRAKGKDLWAVRTMDEPSDASERRAKRVARRRLERRKQRIDLLQSLFAPFMDDELFFIRLNNSGFSFEDKDVLLNKSKNALFNDSSFTDKNFYDLFPTIFHLRKALIEGEHKYDIRFYYLAIHHIIKYRGHFLFEGENVADALNIKAIFETYNAVFENIFGEEAITFDSDKAEDFRKEIGAIKGVRDKVSAGEKLFCIKAADKQKKEWFTLFVGGTAKPFILFDDEEYKENKSISFAKMSDDEFLSLQEQYGDVFDVLEQAKVIYDYMRFEKVLNNNKYISDAMVAIYYKHQQDLKNLKALLKGISKEAYNEMFRDTDRQYNYVNYVGYTSNGRSKKQVKKCKPEEFFKYLKKTLDSYSDQIADDPMFLKIEEEVANGSFLPKILNADNGLFPHQINGVELRKTLDNLCRDYPEMDKKDADGYTFKEKVMSIFTFKIPYYVGPLNTYHSARDGGTGNSWMVRKAPGKITPWNFDQKVDKAKSNEAFMRRMTSKCSYLHGKDVLPKASILYQRFVVLNAINKLRINEEPISVEMKKRLFNELYCKKPDVKIKDIKNFVCKVLGQERASKQDSITVSGLEDGAKITMSSYITLKRILGDLVNTRPDICENIILWHTLNTDKGIVSELIRAHYGDISAIVEKEKELRGLIFKDFGKLSKEFLCEIEGGVDDATGEVYTIIGELYNTNKNLNEILFDEKYTFVRSIEEANGERSADVTYKDVEDLYVSPMVRRGIWQSLLMVDEYIQAIGYAPDKIFVEVTRAKEEKPKRKESRKNRLLSLYNAAKVTGELSKELEATDELKLRQERLFLYYLQLGKCAYTGKQIDLDQLNGDMYDVDHIVPQALVKDDGIDNKVLVLREKNGAKSDTYPLPAGFSDQQGFWKVLHEKELMSDKKYKLLTRTAPLTEEDLNGFVARQLVVTGQTAKAVAELLKRKYGENGTKIVYSKAGNVDDFKKQFGLVKCRETNDLHHARDAYLNIVVGNVYDSVFSSWRSYYYNSKTIRKNMHVENGENKDGKGYNLRTLFYKDQPGGVWKKGVSIDTVKKTFAGTSMTVTKYAFVYKGAFYDETVYGAGQTTTYPRKGKGVLAQKEKYGGFDSPKTAYFVTVASKDKKGKESKSIEAIDVMTHYRTGGDKRALEEVLSRRGFVEPQVGTIIKLKSLLVVDGTPCYIAGRTGDRIVLHNAIQWFTTQDQDRYLKKIGDLLEREKLSKSKEGWDKEEFEMHTNRKNETKLIINRENNGAFLSGMIDQMNKKIYSGLSAMVSFREKVEACRDRFDALSVIDQCKVIMQIAKFLKCNAENADLTLLGKEKRCGMILLGKNCKNNKIQIIDYSPCGTVKRVRSV